MDEIFKMNSPLVSTNNLNTKEIKLTDDEDEDPFSNNDSSSKKSVNSNQPANINIQPVGSNNPTTAATDNNNENLSVKKSVNIIILKIF